MLLSAESYTLLVVLIKSLRYIALYINSSMIRSGVPVYQQSMQHVDKDDLHVCPYDDSHRVAANRFVRHLKKCRKNHLNVEMVRKVIRDC